MDSKKHRVWGLGFIVARWKHFIWPVPLLSLGAGLILYFCFGVGHWTSVVELRFWGSPPSAIDLWGAKYLNSPEFLTLPADDYGVPLEGISVRFVPRAGSFGGRAVLLPVGHPGSQSMEISVTHHNPRQAEILGREIAAKVDAWVADMRLLENESEIAHVKSELSTWASASRLDADFHAHQLVRLTVESLSERLALLESRETGLVTARFEKSCPGWAEKVDPRIFVPFVALWIGVLLAVPLAYLLEAVFPRLVVSGASD